MKKCWIAWLIPFSLFLLSGCGEDPETADKCVESDLISQCPIGTEPTLEANAVSSCGLTALGEFDLVESEGAVTGACSGSAGCRVLCQFSDPCLCGVEKITRDEVVCAECQGGCGDGKCDPGETPESCAIDCGETCVTGQEQCDGPSRMICNQQGVFTPFACPEGTLCSLDNATGSALCTGCNPELNWTYYVDADGDHYGDSTQPAVESCDVVEGYARDGNDCDDTDPDVNPGMQDLCGDGIDNDCQNGIDDSAPTWYQDNDGDGFGTEAASTTACDPPSDSYVLFDGDCDENDDQIHPDAIDLCDGIDNDCDEATDEEEEAVPSCEPGPQQLAICDLSSDPPACDFSCGEGWGDCNESDGCETDLSQPSNCGRCANQCGAGYSCISEGCTDDVIEVVMGFDHLCALLRGGEVWCWGRNANGQLGTGNNDSQETPVLLSSLGGAQDIAAGTYHSCAALYDGSVWCWGANYDNQLGIVGATSSAPVKVTGLEGVLEIDAVGNATCALHQDGKVSCWGRVWAGVLFGGIGNTSTTPVTIDANAISMSMGGMPDQGEMMMERAHLCVIHPDATVSCWGNNEEAQLGDGTVTSQTSPVALGSLSGVVELSAGSYHTCALTNLGEVFCWGTGTQGQLGTGTTAQQRNPIQVSGLQNAREISAGSQHTCALLANGEQQCWGSNHHGQLGAAVSLITALSPVKTQLEEVDQMFATPSGSMRCARLLQGEFGCWANEDASLLGSPEEAPANLLGAKHFQSISMGGDHLCGKKSDGSIWCLGYNTSAQLGPIGDFPPDRTSFLVPLEVSALEAVYPGESVDRLISGGTFTCALTEGQEVMCWGKNHRGQLGRGIEPGVLPQDEDPNPAAVVPMTDSFYPMGPIQDLRLAGTSSGISQDYACALTIDGRVWCWGSDANDKLGRTHAGGNDTDQTYATKPRRFTQLEGVSSLDLGLGSACAIDSTQRLVRCWGDNDVGQLGDTLGSWDYTTTVPGPTDVVDVAVGNGHACALNSTGSVWCWGLNTSGQAGTGDISSDREPPTPPTLVNGLGGDVLDIDAGYSHTCALHQDGTISCWGEGSNGRLGNGSTEDQPAPIKVSGLHDATELSVGHFSTMVLRDGGQIATWGMSWAIGAPRQVYGLP